MGWHGTTRWGRRAHLAIYTHTQPKHTAPSPSGEEDTRAPWCPAAERDAVSISAAASAADIGARGRDSRRGGREPCGGGHRRDRLWQEHSALPDPPPPRIHPSGRHRRHPAPPRRCGLRFQVPLLITFLALSRARGMLFAVWVAFGQLEEL